jgi:hypothetical protein
MSMSIWQGRLSPQNILLDKGRGPSIAAADEVDHQAEVARDVDGSNIVNLTTSTIIIQTQNQAGTRRTIRLVINRKRGHHGVYSAMGNIDLSDVMAMT